MALTVESLSVWDIGFRWAGLDPERFWLRLPLPVKDNFRLIIEAILSGEIICETLTLAKKPRNSKADSRFYIRTYLDDIHHCISGHRYDRKLLKWAELDRMAFKEWCEARGICLPEFWFPPGWKLQFEMPEGGSMALWAEHVEPEEDGAVHISYKKYQEMHEDLPQKNDKPEQADLRKNQQTKLFCQQVAREIWREQPDRTIPSIVEDEWLQKYTGASYYQLDTIKGWIKEVAPPEVRSRRGRPKKKPDATSK